MIRLLFILTALLQGQDKPARLTFEVASIKPTKPGGRGGGIKPLGAGEGYTTAGASVRLMISLMYKVPMTKITGGPGWMDTDLWDIQAKADRVYNLDDLHTMFQNLLEDEFKLKFHKETKQGPVYALTVDKSGSKMKVNDSPEDFKISINPVAPGKFSGVRVTMQYLCYWLGLAPLRNEERPVIDKTGLTGKYDFTLFFMPDLPPGVSRENIPPQMQDYPRIFDALRDQLGLKLDPQKGPVEYYVIDRLEKPAEN